MSVWDDRILEVAREEGGVSVGSLADNPHIRITKSHISKRCRKLADHGLLRKIGQGSYVITDRGEKYLDEEIDVSEERPDEVPEAESETETAGKSQDSGTN